ncbi:MAG: TIGR04255 family protein [Planctomycetota bacterium]
MKFPFLPRAPIVEALIDLRVEAPQGAEVRRLGDLGERIAARYPAREERKGRRVQVDLGPDRASLVREDEPALHGYAFRSGDGRQVVQVSSEGFTVNRLKPYLGWDPLREEARVLWEEYRRIVSPVRVVRLAVRTINRIELPLPVGEMRQFFRTFPEIAPGLPQGMLEFLLRVVVQDPALRAHAIVTQGLEPLAPEATRAPVILDVDVFRECGCPPESPEVWSLLEGLRELKNRVFFESLTERTVDLFR